MARGRDASLGALSDEFDCSSNRFCVADHSRPIEVEPFDPRVSSKPLHLSASKSVGSELRVLQHEIELLSFVDVTQELSIT